MKTQDKLIIKTNYIDESKSWLFSFIIFGLPLWGGFMLSLFFDPIGSLYFLIFLIPVTTLIFLGFIMFRYRKREWHIDKTKEVIQYIKRLRNIPKALKKISFSKVDFLFYKGWEWEYPSSSHIYTLNFLVLPNTIRIFKGEKDVCIKLGIIIAQFLEQSFYYGSWRGKEQIY